MIQDTRPGRRKSRRMSEKRKPGRPRVVGRKPSEGNPQVLLRLPPDVEEHLKQRCPEGGRQAYILGLIRADMGFKSE